MAIYFLKINAALMLLYGFYRLTVSRDTFFSLRRMTLWQLTCICRLAFIAKKQEVSILIWTPRLSGLLTVCRSGCLARRVARL